jgi:lysophospholipase L1-like esterase
MIRRAAIAFFVATSLHAAEPAFPFRPAERVLLLGDSITQQYQYSSYIELYLTTRFPAANMTFYNAGIGGDTATGGANRFANHVLAEKPAVVTIDFGMNDGGYGAFNQPKADQYIKSTDDMLTAAKKAGVRVVLISPNAVDPRAKPPFPTLDLKTYIDTQAKFYEPLKELAAKHGVPFVDQYAVTRKVVEKLAAEESPVQVFPDGIHTNPAGGLLMAHTILTGLRAPDEVSRATVDVAKSKVSGSGCEVKNLESAEDHISFERLDDALPMPVMKEWHDVLPYVNRLKDLNDFGLTATGLKPGKYEVKIDGEVVGAYTADELAAGVNIGTAEAGPVHDQGMKVLAAIKAKNDVVSKRFFQVVRFDPKTLPEWVAGPVEGIAKKRTDELAKRDEQIAEKQAEVYRLAKPVNHKWEVTPVK